MWGLLANVAGQAYNLWQQKKAGDAAVEDYNRQVQVNKALAAEQLAITYNSILAKSLEVGAAARRKEFQIRSETRQASGQAAVQAAQMGVRGKRAELSRKQQVEGVADRTMAELQLDTTRAQDDLIRRADMEERATINRLISGMPDVPVDHTGSNTLDFVGGVLDSYSTYKQNKQEINDAVVFGSQGNISSTGTNQFGVQAKL